MNGTRIHPTADVDGSAIVGSGSLVWHLAQIRENARLGRNCIVGRGAYVGPGVVIGDNVKLQNYALVYEPARLEDHVFIGPGSVLTNDVYPRSVDVSGNLKRPEDWNAVGVLVREGASLGARAVVVAGCRIGRWALIAAGAVVTRDVPDFALVAGTPARRIGWVGRAGVRLVTAGENIWRCPQTGELYREANGVLWAHDPARLRRSIAREGIRAAFSVLLWHIADDHSCARTGEGPGRFGTLRGKDRRMSPIGLAVIGAGYWGPNLVRTALATPALQLKWLCDLDIERARTALGSYTTVRVTDSYEAVLADVGVAAVAIATPAASHFELVRSALEAGKHVLVEKPLTSSAADGEKLAALARQSGSVLMCDHTYCYTPTVRRIRDLVRGGEIGNVQFVDSVRTNLGLVQPDVDVLWDLGPHDLSILDFVLPECIRPIAVAAHTSDPIDAGRACVAYLTLWLSNGALAHVHVNWLSPTKIRTTVLGGSRRTIVWDDTNPAARLAIHDRGVDMLGAGSLRSDERRQALISYRTGDTLVPALQEREALMSVMAEFSSAIAEHREPLTDAESGLRVLRLLEAASRSADGCGARIPLNGTWS